MNWLERFGAYAQDFEKTYEDDDWTRLDPYFTRNAIYRIEGVPWACELRGRDSIFAGIKKSLDGFDRRMDDREIRIEGVPEVDDHMVTITARVRYSKEPYDSIEAAIRVAAEFDDAGRITNLYDTYPEGQVEILEWIEAHADEVDPSYL